MRNVSSEVERGLDVVPLPRPLRRAGESDVRAIWAYRELLRSLTVRNLKVKYQRSSLGLVWTLLNPLITVMVLALVFTHVLKIGREMPHYVAFLLSGYFVWNTVQQTVSSGTYILSEHGPLMRATPFPKEVPVLAAALSRLIEFAAEMLLVLAALAVWHHGGVPSSFLALPWLIVAQVALSLGLVLPIAALAVFYKDVQHALPLVLATLFYLTPVFYPASMVPEAARTVYMANPLAQLLTAYHTVIYDGRFPSLAQAGALTLTSGAILLVGYVIFSRHKATFAEVA